MLNVKILVTLIAISTIFVAYPAFGQTSHITVTTDKPSYADGDTIIISGTVTSQLNIPISVVIKDSSNTPVYIAQTNPDPSTNAYSVQAVAGGNLWKTAGIYEIDVTYGGPDNTAKTTFQFTTTSQHPSNTTNQTTVTPAIPEFGPLATVIFAVSIAVITVYAKIGLPSRFN